MSESIPSQTSGSPVASKLAVGAAVFTLVSLAALHVLSPEFNPSWRMVSEYALGGYGFVLSLMFVSWAISTWTLACAIRPYLRGVAAHIGLVFLIAAGLGEVMASIFDVKHSLHGLAAMIGIPSLPIAAMLVSDNLSRRGVQQPARTTLLWTANLTWISFVLMAVAMAIFVYTYQRSGGVISPETEITSLPEGVITLHGWANRLLIVAYCVWAITAARFVARGIDQASRKLTA